MSIINHTLRALPLGRFASGREYTPEYEPGTDTNEVQLHKEQGWKKANDYEAHSLEYANNSSASLKHYIWCLV